jgi:hypothetical protein
VLTRILERAVVILREGAGRQETILKILSDLTLMCQSRLRRVWLVADLLHVPTKTQ